MKNKTYLYLGIAAPVVFWLTLFVGGAITEDYNHFVNYVSELGAIGAKSQYLFTAGLVLVSALSVFFIVGVFRLAKRNAINLIPILLILTFSISVFGAAVFPLPLRMHGIAGSPSMLMPLSPLLALIFWKNDQLKGVKLFSTITLIAMAAGFLIQFPEILGDYHGLKQRFFHLGWTIWFVWLSVAFIKLQNRES